VDFLEHIRTRKEIKYHRAKKEKEASRGAGIGFAKEKPKTREKKCRERKNPANGIKGKTWGTDRVHKRWGIFSLVSRSHEKSKVWWV